MSISQSHIVGRGGVVLNISYRGPMIYLLTPYHRISTGSETTNLSPHTTLPLGQKACAIACSSMIDILFPAIGSQSLICARTGNYLINIILA